MTGEGAGQVRQKKGEKKKKERLRRYCFYRAKDQTVVPGTTVSFILSIAWA